MDGRKIGVLGGGQLGRMLVESANNRNISVIVLDKAGSPAKQVINSGIDGSFTNARDIKKLAEICDILTIEIEHVDTFVLEALEKESYDRGKPIEIQPSWQTIRTIQDKFEQKVVLANSDLALARFDAVYYKSKPSESDLDETARSLGFPFMLKARKGAYDGRGNYPVRSPEDFRPALDALKDRPLYAEDWANFTKELAVMVVKIKNDVALEAWELTTLAYPTVETVQEVK